MPYSAKLTTRELVLLGLLLAAAVILRLMENILPFPIQIPGARLGLANSVTIIALLLFGPRRTALLLLARLLLVGVISTGLLSPGFLIGLGGAACSFAAMALAIRTGLFSPVGIGVTGACAHNCGQLLAAMLLLQSTAPAAYLPLLLVIAIPTGFSTGLIARLVLPVLRRENQNRQQ